MTTHTERILVPLDGSLLAEAVLPVAEALARDHDAELVLLRVTGAAVEPARTGEQIEAETYLARLSRALQQEGLGRVRTVVGHGRPDLAIVEAAEQHRVNLIAMTTHGRTGLGRVLVGSVADSVVRAAAAPALLVHRQAEWRTGRTTQVLVPLDGSALGEAILPAVERLAGPLDFEFHLLHAVEASPAGSIALDAADAERYLAGVAGRLEAKGLRVRFAVRVGRAVEAIPGYVEEHAIGLVAMSTHGRSGVRRLLLGSVAEHVLTAVAVPVVLWKEGRQETR